ncbi:MAG: hypothetical protein FWE44_04690 [Defluviitaleaceae bacterium]|nr:hypothetical protein [Defluviitaleaceae bacterium]
MLDWITNFTYKIENKAAKAGFVFRIASGYYKDVIQKEITLANITKDDHILCIGGGICPFSAILFHKTTGAKVTVIDNNEACIPKAQQAIERLGFGKHITVCHQDGNCPNFDYTAFTVIHLALQISPMEQVFANAVEKAAAGTRLLVRRPKKVLENAYCPMFSETVENSPFASHKSRNIGCTLLYTKQGEPA